MWVRLLTTNQHSTYILIVIVHHTNGNDPGFVPTPRFDRSATMRSPRKERASRPESFCVGIESNSWLLEVFCVKSDSIQQQQSRLNGSVVIIRLLHCQLSLHIHRTIINNHDRSLYCSKWCRNWISRVYLRVSCRRVLLLRVSAVVRRHCLAECRFMLRNLSHGIVLLFNWTLAGKSTMTLFLCLFGCQNVLGFRSLRVWPTAQRSSAVKPTFKRTIAGIGVPLWLFGMRAWVSFPLLDCCARYRSWFTTCFRTAWQIICAWILKWHTEADRRGSGFSSLFFPNSRTWISIEEGYQGSSKSRLIIFASHEWRSLLYEQWIGRHIFYRYPQEKVDFLALVPSHYCLALLLAFLCHNESTRNFLCGYELWSPCHVSGFHVCL